MRYAYYPTASYRDAKGQLILEYSAIPFMDQAQQTEKIDSTAAKADSPDKYRGDMLLR